uniref:Uncharacterized protein n=1 Tax=Marmota marmota marmota TaxID=9994 RepID=A0A8C5ZQ97_MARMA
MVYSAKSEAKIAFLQSYPENVTVTKTQNLATCQCPTIASLIPFTQYLDANKQLGRRDRLLLMS